MTKSRLPTCTHSSTTPPQGAGCRYPAFTERGCFVPCFLPPHSPHPPVLELLGAQLLAPRGHPGGAAQPSQREVPHCPLSPAERAGVAEGRGEAAPFLGAGKLRIQGKEGVLPGEGCLERADIPGAPAGTPVPWGAHPSPDCLGARGGNRQPCTRAGRGQWLGPPPPPSSAPHGWARPPPAQQRRGAPEGAGVGGGVPGGSARRARG